MGVVQSLEGVGLQIQFVVCGGFGYVWWWVVYGGVYGGGYCVFLVGFDFFVYGQGFYLYVVGVFVFDVELCCCCLGQIDNVFGMEWFLVVDVYYQVFVVVQIGDSGVGGQWQGLVGGGEVVYVEWFIVGGVVVVEFVFVLGGQVYFFIIGGGFYYLIGFVLDVVGFGVVIGVEWFFFRYWFGLVFYVWVLFGFGIYFVFVVVGIGCVVGWFGCLGGGFGGCWCCGVCVQGECFGDDKKCFNYRDWVFRVLVIWWDSCKIVMVYSLLWL